jgi:hypothetical protein
MDHITIRAIRSANNAPNHNIGLLMKAKILLNILPNFTVSYVQMDPKEEFIKILDARYAKQVQFLIIKQKCVKNVLKKMKFVL